MLFCAYRRGGLLGHPSTPPGVGAVPTTRPQGPVPKEHHMTGRSVSAVTAYTAHREWASRPPDERYASVPALHKPARARGQQLEQRPIETGEFRTEAVDHDLAFRESSG